MSYKDGWRQFLSLISIYFWQNLSLLISRDEHKRKSNDSKEEGIEESESKKMKF